MQDVVARVIGALTISEWGTFWSAVGAIATLCGAGAILFAVRQLRFEAMMKAHELFNTELLRQYRGELFARFDRDPRPFDDAEKERALYVVSQLDIFVRLESYIGRRRLLRIWGNPIAKTWLLVQDLVADERSKVSWPEKWDALEAVGKAAVSEAPALAKLPGAKRLTLSKPTVPGAP